MASKEEILQDELLVDATIDYSGMIAGVIPNWTGTDFQGIADSVNTENRTRNRDTLSGPEVLDETDWTEYGVLGDLKKNQWLSFTSAREISATKAGLNVLRDIFGTGTTTETNLLAVRQETISRATEIGVGFRNAGDVLKALNWDQV